LSGLRKTSSGCAAASPSATCARPARPAPHRTWGKPTSLPRPARLPCRGSQRTPRPDRASRAAYRGQPHSDPACRPRTDPEQSSRPPASAGARTGRRSRSPRPRPAPPGTRRLQHERPRCRSNRGPHAKSARAPYSSALRSMRNSSDGSTSP
jgi:hypothetical protein